MATTYYNANQNLKAVGVPVEFTEEQVKEYIKCKRNPIYFIENYCKIVSLDEGVVDFKLYACQKRKVKHIMKNRQTILMEGRQQGKTVVSAACILHFTLFNDNKTAAIMANKATAAREVLSRYQLMYEYLPNWMQQGVAVWNKGDIELENGSKIFTAATSSSAIRGKSVNWLYIDEAAIIPNTVAEEFFTSVYPTISAGKDTKVLLSSTPLGYNHFWRYWEAAQEGRNDFKPLFIPYTDIPGRTKTWAEKQRALLGELKFNQEVLCEFLGSSSTLISASAIGDMKPKPFILQRDGLDVQEEPIPGHSYTIVADTAKGVGGDYSAFVVIDTTAVPYKVVAKYRNNSISPLLYPNIIDKIGKEYYNAQILVETNASEQVPYILYNELEYENMIMVSRTNMGQKITGGFGAGKSQYGVQTDKKIKRIGCQNLKTLIDNGKLQIYDGDIISEISTFIESKGSYAADDGYHDDLVMCLVLFGWLTSDQYFTEMNDVNLREEMYKNQMKQIEEELTPFGFINDGQKYDDDEELINF